MPSIRRSLVLSFAQNYTGMLVTVPTIMILARFLTPEETGIFSVAVAVTGLAHMLRDFGVGAYLIQEQDLDNGKIRSAFTITLLTAWIIAAGIFALAPLASRFYHESGVNDVLKVLSINFLMIPFGAPALSLLRREMSYGILYIINTVSAVARSATSIILAVLGFSYMSLAWGSLAGVAASTLVVGYYRSSETWLLPGLSEWRRVLSFGTKKTLIDILLQFNASANNLVVGRMLGLAATGLYSRGQGLLGLFQGKVLSSIQSVAFPAFASYHRSGKGINAFYIKGVRYITAVAWPFYAFVAIMAYPIILSAFGQQWLESAPILRILTIGAALSTLNFSLGQAYMASGNINTSLKVSAVVQPIRLGLIIWAAFYNIEAVAGVGAASALISLFFNYREAGKLFDLHLRDVFRATYSSLGIAIISSVIPALMYALYEGKRISNPWAVLIISGVGAVLGWLIGVYVTSHPIMEEVNALWSRPAFKRFRRI